MIKHLTTIDSTSTYIKEHINELDNFDIVYADHQTAGKGRTGHVWEDDDNQNILMSIAIKDADIIKEFNILSIATGVIVLEFLKNYLSPKSISLKWPNDVYVNGNKICGILLEGKLPDYVILGIGLNVNQTDFSIDNATSLSLETEYSFNLNDVRELFFNHLLNSFNKYINNKDKYIRDFNAHSYLKGKLVSFNYRDKQAQGIAGDINNDGSLQISIDKKTVNVFFDEVSMVR